MKGAAVYFVSTLWSTASWVARRLPSHEAKLPCRVISVGNLQAGGSGKTPLVARIASEAAARGLRACILIRGYRSEWEKSGGLLGPGAAAAGSVRSRGLACAREAGDEALLLHDLCPHAPIAVGRDRALAFERARRECGPLDLAILDDGFQNRSVHKDLEVLAVTAQRPSEVPFRDFPRAIERAGLVVWTKGGERPWPHARPEVIARFHSRVLHGARESSRPLWLVSGVGAPLELELAIARADGRRPVRHLSFGDHAEFSTETIQKIEADAKAAGAQLAMTGKDWVKWRERSKVPVLVYETEVLFDPEGERVWNRVLWGP